ncbi:MAG: UDP-N-acetylglucosamine 2-epimerase (non-hydrolyzing) [Acidobacteria bacterium]|nr:UDP-N-acetylglucosamine 2-epimerase (non-hydrolyzing) [Acidobacteriota bacterium]MCW5949118.1 UDP-N-acetylglucosamine 2-epimerase (non-hydrolyzing) [Pyrinomonadaceae bacterium]
MRVLTIFGTRPEIIRLSLVMKLLDQHCEHITVHTGQNYHESLSDVFIRDLKVRQPDHNLGIKADTFSGQIGQVISKCDEVIEAVKPDRILILGDTNSALSAIPAARRRIPVFHMEAGNRCYDDRVPEEVNRRLIDHASTVLLPYTERSKENLVREGIERERIFVTGNPIKEVLDHFDPQIESSDILSRLGLSAFDYLLVTLHRAENVDIPDRLAGIFRGLEAVADKFSKQVLVSVHPRTAEKLRRFKVSADSEKVRLLDAFGFFDFVHLEKNSLAVLTDSGTVQEECSIFRIPNVTIRDVTERPETLECGSNILSGADPEAIVSAVELAVAQPASWDPPKEYLASNVASTVSKLILGYHSLRVHR